MAWFLRAVQRQDGEWTCRHGVHEFDRHSDLEEAVAHLRLLATEIGPARLFLHPYGGEVVGLGPGD